jgi:hypothetical protein
MPNQFQPDAAANVLPPADTTPDPNFRDAYYQRGRGQLFPNGEAPQFVDQRSDRSQPL